MAIRLTIVDPRDPASSHERGFVLDRTREARTDKDGRFRWDKVEPGVRGVCFPGKDLGGGRRGRPERYWGVRVEAGKTTRVTLGPGIPKVEVRVLDPGGKPHAGSLDGILVGLERVFTFPPPFRGKEGLFTVERVLPGRYYLLSRRGRGILEIHGGKAEVRLGGADLTVFAKPRTTLALYPGDAHSLLRVMCLRAARFFRRRAGKDGRLHFPGLPPGTYILSTPRERKAKKILISGPGTTADCTSW